MGTSRLKYVAVPVGLALAAALAACGGDDGPKPDATANALATALSSGDLSSLTFVHANAGDVQTSYEQTLGDLSEVKPKVTVGSVSDDGDGKATA